MAKDKILQASPVIQRQPTEPKSPRSPATSTLREAAAFQVRLSDHRSAPAGGLTVGANGGSPTAPEQSTSRTTNRLINDATAFDQANATRGGPADRGTTAQREANWRQVQGSIADVLRNQAGWNSGNGLQGQFAPENTARETVARVTATPLNNPVSASSLVAAGRGAFEQTTSEWRDQGLTADTFGPVATLQNQLTAINQRGYALGNSQASTERFAEAGQVRTQLDTAVLTQARRTGNAAGGNPATRNGAIAKYLDRVVAAGVNTGAAETAKDFTYVEDPAARVAAAVNRGGPNAYRAAAEALDQELEANPTYANTIISNAQNSVTQIANSMASDMRDSNRSPQQVADLRTAYGSLSSAIHAASSADGQYQSSARFVGSLLAKADTGNVSGGFANLGPKEDHSELALGYAEALYHDGKRDVASQVADRTVRSIGLGSKTGSDLQRSVVAQSLVDPVGAATPRDAYNVAETLSQIPPEHLQMLRDQGATVKVAHENVGEISILNYVETSPALGGRTYADAAAGYYNSSNERLATTAKDTTTIVHEVGHFLDEHSDDPALQSDNPDFLAARTADFNQLRDYVRQPEPYGSSETFADSYMEHILRTDQAKPHLRAYWDRVLPLKQN